MNEVRTIRESPERLTELGWRWLRPLFTLLIFGAVAVALRRELSAFRLSEMLAHLRAISASAIVRALACTVASYWLLGFYDVLALNYLGKPLRYLRAAATSFIAYALAHNV